MDVDVDLAEAMEIVNEETEMMNIDQPGAAESLPEAGPPKKPRLTLRQLREQYAVGRVVNRLKDSLLLDSLANKDEVSDWFESNLPHIHAEVEPHRHTGGEKHGGWPSSNKVVVVLAVMFKFSLLAAAAKEWMAGSWSANEKGDLFFFGNKFARCLRYARGKISKYHSEIDMILDQDPEVVKLRDKVTRIDEDRKNHHGPFDPAAGIFQKDEEEKVKLLSEIGLLKVVLQGKSAETRELHQHILRLRGEMKARSVRFMDEFSNFCCAFRTIVAPAFSTPSVSSTKRKHQLDTESKDLLKYINHESLLKLIKQKVEARVIVTSEAFTTKTC
ncbi:hypothetical protein HDU96_002020 [Phlyctochytrium bullatum]|nr:hypothetical protein HDU96_002020 [Phlyctochytrium bullatum]